MPSATKKQLTVTAVKLVKRAIFPNGNGQPLTNARNKTNSSVLSSPMV